MTAPTDAERMREMAAKIAEDDDGMFSWAGQDGNVAMLQQCCREIAADIRALPLPASNDPHGEMLAAAERDAADGVPIDLPPPADDAAAIEAAIGAYNCWVNINQGLRAAISAYHIACFGGDPGDELAKYKIAWLEENEDAKRHRTRIAELEAENAELRGAIASSIDAYPYAQARDILRAALQPKDEAKS